MHANSAALLAQRGLRTEHRARRLTPALAARQDLILVADRFNLRDGRAIAAATEQKPTVRLLRDFDPQAAGEDLDDPWSYPMEAYERAAAEILSAIPGILMDLKTR